MLYMCMKDNGPLYQDDAPMVFEDVADAEDVLQEVGEGFVAEIEPGTIVRRLRDAGIEQVYYQPSGLHLAETRRVEGLEGADVAELGVAAFGRAEELERAAGRQLPEGATLAEALAILEAHGEL